MEILSSTSVIAGVYGGQSLGDPKLNIVCNEETYKKSFKVWSYEEKIKISTSKVYHTWGGAIRVAKRGN